MKKPTRSMTDEAKDYLAYRRALGFQLKTEGALLLQFAKFAESSGHVGPVTTALALRWAQRPEGVSSLYRGRRLEIVRCFARYQSIFHKDTDIPPQKLLGPCHHRTTPYIYSEEQIAQLMLRARRLSPRPGLRGGTYSTLFGLLASTGLRISEALRLSRDDADTKRGLLRVHATKFRKSRLVPLDDSVTAALRRYARLRDAYHPTTRAAAFFVGADGSALPYGTVRSTFRSIVDSLGWRTPAGRPPRLYDLRHTFVCRVLLRWYREGVDVNQAIASLATYVGHVKPTDTYWYITGTPELMAAAGDRFEASTAGPEGAADETHV